MQEAIIRVRDVIDLDFIGSRYAGEVLREKIDAAIKEGKVAVLDFEGVTGITQSFGDEILGIYIRAYGVEFAKKHLKFVNLHPNVRQILKWVFAYSRQYSTRETHRHPQPAYNPP